MKQSQFILIPRYDLHKQTGHQQEEAFFFSNIVILKGAICKTCLAVEVILAEVKIHK